MNTNKMTMAELPDAVEAYANAGFDPDAMRPLMDLLQEQTDYYQKRFWNEVAIVKLWKETMIDA